MRFHACLVRAFTSDESVADALLDEKLWTLLAFSQPLNAAVFCLDGLVYAFQDFGFVREAFEVGVGYVFVPTLAWAYGKTPTTLAAVWTAKVALNVEARRRRSRDRGLVPDPPRSSSGVREAAGGRRETDGGCEEGRGSRGFLLRDLTESAGWRRESGRPRRRRRVGSPLAAALVRGGRGRLEAAGGQ